MQRSQQRRDEARSDSALFAALILIIGGLAAAAWIGGLAGVAVAVVAVAAAMWLIVKIV